MSNNWEPCKCGSKYVAMNYTSPQAYWVECIDCETKSEVCSSREKAISDWNRRAQPAEADGVEVVGYRFFHVDHGYIFRPTHIYEGNPSLEAHSLMTVAQHHRILSAVTAERDRLAKDLKNAFDTDLKMAVLCEQEDEIKQLRAEVDALRPNALRYRWLREQEAEDGIAVLPVGRWEKPAMLCTTPFDSPEMVDSVVDAAMAAKEG